MLAWRFTDGAGEDLTVRLRDVRSGGGILASPSALDALSEGDGTWCAMVELSGEVVREDLMYRAQRVAVLARFDARDLLVRWATECGCPATVVAIDPVASALLWSPGRDEPEYLAASDTLAKWLIERTREA